MVLSVTFPKRASPGKFPEGFMAKGWEVSRAGVMFQLPSRRALGSADRALEVVVTIMNTLPKVK